MCGVFTRGFSCFPTYLVEAEEAQVSDHVEGADPGAGGDLSSHLQADLDDLQRVGENHLGSSGLDGRGRLQRRKQKINKWEELKKKKKS